MPVNHFGRVTERIRWYGFQTLLVNSSGRLVGKDNAVTKLGKECEPERVILVHVEYSWQADLSLNRGSLWKGLIVEYAIQLILVKVGNGILWQSFAYAAFTAVAGLINFAAGEFEGGDKAVVAAYIATIVGPCDGEGAKV